ncbi:MAG: hypothetical protein KGZ81_09785 [Flavobacteriales bacterium]|nr:hypothetical protein [Flavobacteriales bacterium]MDP2160505.1 heavy metal-binding domain-containing protein [Flavobacterium sp.]
MKTKITTAALLLTAVMFMASCESKTSENKTDKTEQTENAMYQCPMKCEGEKMYEEKGTCPVCKMDLELVSKEDEHKHHNH